MSENASDSPARETKTKASGSAMKTSASSSSLPIRSRLKIIGAGFGRCGTGSTYEALNILGFKCYHMKEVLKHPEHIDFWHDLGTGKVARDKVQWNALFNDYDACTDWPCCEYWKELMIEYPDAVVILNVRDPERWYESAYNTIYAGTATWHAWICSQFSPVEKKFREMVVGCVWQGTMRGQMENKSKAIEIFNEHVERVKATVPPKKLLVYSVKEGWEPLCAFLNCDVPDVPFPQINSGEEFRVWVARKQWKARVILSVPLLLSGVALAYWWKKRNA